MPGLVLIHGLPGAGKSSLCRELDQMLDGVYYADAGQHPDFRSRSMSRICADMYEANGAGRSLLIEGVCAAREGRDALVSQVISRVEQCTGIGFVNPRIIFLDESLPVLASRRNRSEHEYRELRASVSIGSRAYRYTIYSCAPGQSESVQERAQNFVSMMPSECGTTAP